MFRSRLPFRVRSSLSIAVVVTTLALGAAPAEASGALRMLSLEQAVRSASYVLLVAADKPASETRTVTIVYEKKGKPTLYLAKTSFVRLRVLRVLRVSSSLPTSVSGRSRLRPSKKTVSLDLRALAKKAAKVRLIGSTTITNHNVRVRYLKDGTRKIPIYRELKIGLQPNAHKGTMLLLANYSLAYEGLVGVGGLGLVSVKHRKRVEKILAKVKR